MKLATVPNFICLLRIALTVPIVVLLAEGRYDQTLVLFAIAAVSDMLDGYLAKTFGWTSEVGKWLDPLADKLLLVSVFITLAVIGLVPVWLAAVAVARDVVIAGGAGIYKWLFGPVEGRPTCRRSSIRWCSSCTSSRSSGRRLSATSRTGWCRASAHSSW